MFDCKLIMRTRNFESLLHNSQQLNLRQVMPEGADLAVMSSWDFPASSVVTRLGLGVVRFGEQFCWCEMLRNVGFQCFLTCFLPCHMQDPVQGVIENVRCANWKQDLNVWLA